MGGEAFKQPANPYASAGADHTQHNMFARLQELRMAIKVDAEARPSARAATRRIGRAWRVLGVVLFLLGVFGVNVAQQWQAAYRASETAGSEAFTADSIVLWLAQVGLIAIGGFVVIHGRQLQAKAMARFVRQDTRRPVLFFRSFGSERSLLRSVLLGVFVPSWYFEFFYTEEEQLAEALSGIGPFVAIGKPGETLPKLGAIRIYARNEAWQQVVTDKLTEARLVVVQAGTSEGLWWEISESLRSCSPSQVLLYFLRMPRKHYNAFADRLQLEHGIVLPKVRQRPGKVSGFIRFHEGWKAEAMHLDAPTFRITVSKPLRGLFAYALRPVFNALGVEWDPPPISTAKIVASLLLMIPFISLLNLLLLLA